jgi:PIN domain nuclease of toxin-antitoxin system
VRLLLDTHIVLWNFAEVGRLRPAAEQAIRDAYELHVSTVSFAEIGVKASAGKLQAPPDLQRHIENAGARLLHLTPEHGLGVAGLPLHHRDPFDRLLISQARIEGLAILTADARIPLYDVATIDAGR